MRQVTSSGAVAGARSMRMSPAVRHVVQWVLVARAVSFPAEAQQISWRNFRLPYKTTPSRRHDI